MLIPAENLKHLRGDIEELNKRARRLGVPEIELIQGTFPIYQEDEDRLRQYFTVTIKGDEIKLPGWEFVASIEHMADNINIVYENPKCDIDTPIKYRHASSGCDHCGVNRYRKKTYVLRNESGEFRQVGSTCLKDFIGHGDPEALARLAEKIWQLDLDDYLEPERYGQAERFFDAIEVLAYANVAIRKLGYISRNKAEYEGKEATADTVRRLVRGTADEQFIPTDEDRAVAQKAIDHAKTLDVDASQSYHYNLKTLAQMFEYHPHISYKQIGFMAGMLLQYLIDCVWEPARQALKDQICDEHFGTIKKREEFELQVVFVKVIDGHYGITTMVKFVDQQNRQAIWWASGNKEDMFVTDEWYRVKATVKDHGEYEGKKQTIINRVEILNELVPTA